MAERIVSPGVFTIEKDQSFLAPGIGEIGPVVVGPTIKGPAQVPTIVRSWSDFQDTFGSYTPDSYVPLTAKRWLDNQGTLTIVRLLYENGYKLTNGALGIIATSGSVSYVTHLLHPTITISSDGANEVFENSVLASDTSGSFRLKISGSYTSDSGIPNWDGTYTSTGFISQSIDPTPASPTTTPYIKNIYGTDPKGLNYPVYLQYEDKAALASFSNQGHVTMSLGIIGNYEFLQDFQAGSTPWITSQKIGSAVQNLFRFHTLSHGNAENYDIKIAIADIKLASEVANPNDYGTFTVIIRAVNDVNPEIPNNIFVGDDFLDRDDTDLTPKYVGETFTNCNLDPVSPGYIGKKIGNLYKTINSAGKLKENGSTEGKIYPNISKFIRVETVPESVFVGNKTLVPFGFRAPYSPIPDATASGSTGKSNLRAASYVTTSTNNLTAYYFGFDFTNASNMNYLAPIPTSGSKTGSNSDFYMGDVSQSSGLNYPPGDSSWSGSFQQAMDKSLTVAGNLGSFAGGGTINPLIKKFILPFQKGFDGAKPNLPKYSGADITAANTFGFACNSTSATGTLAYKKAFNTLGNTDYYDINMLFTPGIIESLHPAVTADARNLAVERQDTFYVQDSNERDDSINTIISTVTSIDSNYTATYYPWVNINELGVGKWVPPSVVVAGALSFNDKVKSPWYAPAGLNRGSLTGVNYVEQNLTQTDRDDLYEARINPIANFPNAGGVVIWGQKTLQARPSALDRVNVRRLLITVKKFIASATKYLVFEQNTTETRLKFLGIVNPYLAAVKADQGLSTFRVVMDETNNTPDLIDQNILYGQIFLQPTRTAEFIVLDFNIQPTGASFPE